MKILFEKKSKFRELFYVPLPIKDFTTIIKIAFFIAFLDLRCRLSKKMKLTVFSV